MIKSILFKRFRIDIWLVGVSFVLFQFFMQLSSGVVISAISKEIPLTALMIGLLGSVLYIIYTVLQIPVGVFFDRKDTKRLLSGSAALCSLGCMVFGFSHSLSGLFIGRFLIGFGSAFAFVGFSHVLRSHFPLKQFGFLIGLSETLAFIVTMFGIMGLGELLEHHSWRNFIKLMGLTGLFISFLCWKYIPSVTQTKKNPISCTQQILPIILNYKAWINGLFVGLSFILVTVFGALWAIPFIEIKLNCTLGEASILDALFFLGAGISCPLFGILSNLFERRRPLILCSCLSSTFLILCIIYFPIHQPWIMAALLFILGCCCGAYMLAYTIANELAPAHLSSTSTGFTNTLAMITAPILQPAIGYMLDILEPDGNYTLCAYQIALAIIPLSLIAASMLALFLPEKNALDLRAEAVAG